MGWRRERKRWVRIGGKGERGKGIGKRCGVVGLGRKFRGFWIVFLFVICWC